MNSDAIAKIKMMRASLRCFVFGLLGLLPFVGFPFAAAALVASGQVRAGQKRFWNPAKAYWIIGLVGALLGALFWAGIFGLILCNIALNDFHSSDDLLGLTYLVIGTISWFVIVISLIYLINSRSKL